MGLPYGSHKEKSLMRIISPTLSGIFTNHVLDYIILNILKGRTDGFFTGDGDGSSIYVFMDVSDPGWLSCCISGDWCNMAQCRAVLLYSTFSVPISAWSARILIQIRSKLLASTFYKGLGKLNFTKISAALSSNRTLHENGRKECIGGSVN